ncbi:MAG: DUF1772 domain-containing protein [Pseudoclavibacter sp.]|nr:DUF1772 domain-containing protein [Pseudoclavibacter sp.]
MPPAPSPSLFAALLVTGFVGCAEFASFALVHPVVRSLPADAQLAMERGLLGTFGRVMPIGMTLAPCTAALAAWRPGGAWFAAAAAALLLALLVTIAGNVPINRRTGRIRGGTPPPGFLRMRRRWDALQGVRGGLQLLGFLLVAAGASFAEAGAAA